MRGHEGVRRGGFAAAAAVAAVVLLAAGSVGLAASPTEHLHVSNARSLRGTTTLDSQLAAVAATARSAGPVAAAAIARSHALAATAAGVRVEVVARDRAQAEVAVQRAGGTVDGAVAGLIEATVPPSALGALASDSAVAHVRAPVRPYAQAVPDEGVQTTGAAWFHALHGATQFDGTGVKVAVIDVGFAGLPVTGVSGPVEPVPVPGGTGATTDQGCIPGEQHGVAVAQIVHAMAPGAQLFLYCAADEVALRADEQDAVAKGVKIINHSVAWFNTGRGDGTALTSPGGPAVPTPESTVSDAAAHGILWVNAAGNDASTHWRGTYTPDPASPDFNEFGGGDDGNTVGIAPGDTGCAYLRWDSWPVTTHDFDLYLADPSGNVVAQSIDDQTTAPAPPVETLCYANPASATNSTFSIFINRFSAAVSPTMDLWFEGDSNLQYATVAGSVDDPASSPDALAVGAVCWATGAVEAFSSNGPTIDGRTKPDIAGPDSTSGTVLGDYGGVCGSGFAGTSAAAPHVAGLAALLLDAEPLGLHALRNALVERSARHAGPTVQDNLVGAGAGFLFYPPAGEPAIEQGRLAYSVENGAHFGLYTAQPDGSDPTLIATDGSTGNGSSGASWTSDGKILRESFGQIQSIDPATGAVSNLTSGFSDASPNAQLQNGTSIVFARFNDISTMNRDGSSEQSLHVTGSSPVWSPDGTQIAYAARNNITGATDIQVMNADGTGSHAVTTTGTDVEPVWSPDGSQIAFVITDGGRSFGIGVMNADGSNRHVLVANAGSAVGTIAAWSPDAALIAYQASSGSARWIQIIDLAGNKVSAITTPADGDITGLSWTSQPPIIGAHTSAASASLGGELKAGQWLHANTLEWLGDPLPAADFTWRSCDASLSSCSQLATGSPDYRLTPADVGRRIAVDAAATNDAGTVALSAATSAVSLATPFASSAPTVTGTTTAGQTLSASPGGWEGGGSPSFAYQWRRCVLGPLAAGQAECIAIAGATSAAYVPVVDDVGRALQVAVSATTGGGTGVALSNFTGAIAAAPAASPPPPPPPPPPPSPPPPSPPPPSPPPPSPPPPPPGGGSGGGGGSAPPNLHVLLEAVSSPQKIGDLLTYRVTLSNRAQASQSTTLSLDLPVQTTYGGATVQRGPGCTAAGHVVQCPLDFFPGGGTSVVTVSGRVDQLGDLTARASVASSPADGDPSDDAATLTVHVGGPATPPAGGGNSGGASQGKVLNGTARNDTLVGSARADRINGGKGNDRIKGLGGNDRLVGGPGRDTIFGGAGNDTILVRDHERDVVDCGPGRDTVTADKKDAVARNCEIVHRR